MKPLNIATNSTTNLLFVSVPRPCVRCGVVSREYYFAAEEGEDGGYLCSKCKYELNPPAMFLQIVQNHIYPEGKLFSPQRQKFEKVLGLGDFEACGWFIKKRWIYDRTDFKSTMVSQRTIEAIMLKYYGDRKCKRINRYEFWPLGYKKCMSIYCDPTHLDG